MKEESEWRNIIRCDFCKNVIGYSATDKALQHPNNPKWQKQKERQYISGFGQIRTNISEMTLEEISEQESIISSMANALREVSALKGSTY